MEVFCSPDKGSVEHCGRYLQQELQLLGLPPILDEEGGELTVPKLFNTMYKLLQLYRHSLKSTEQLKEGLQRAKSDHMLQAESKDRLKEDLKSKERAIATVEDQVRQLSAKTKSLSSNLRTEQEEVRRLKLSAQYRETQYSHENKKKEKELEKLKNKLSQSMSAKNADRRMEINMMATLNRADGKRKQWGKPGKSDEEIYGSLLAKYEERQKELMLENESLRESMEGMQMELVGLLNEKKANETPKSVSLLPSSRSAASPEARLSPGHFQMPYDIVRGGIEHGFREKCRRIRQHIEELSTKIEKLEQTSESLEDHTDPSQQQTKIQRLEQKLSDYKVIIDQQEELLQRCAEEREAQLGEGVSVSPRNEQDKYEAARKDLQEEKKYFESETLEAMQKLSAERREFEDERNEFEREKFLEASVLNTTRELDSFFTKLPSSTPSRISHQQASSRGSELDLRHSFSLCSDDGEGVLNDKVAETA